MTELKREFLLNYPGSWALVKAGGENYIGQVSNIDDNFVVLNPCYEYMNSFGQTPDGNLVRNNVAIPMDMVLDESLSKLRYDFIMFFDDLSDDDFKEYQRVVKQCLEVVEHTKMARIKARSNIEVVGAMPQNVQNSPIFKK